MYAEVRRSRTVPASSYWITAARHEIEEQLDISRRATTISIVGEYHTQHIVVKNEPAETGMSRKSDMKSLRTMTPEVCMPEESEVRTRLTDEA